MADLPIPSTHPDYLVLKPLVNAILGAAGGWHSFALDIPQLIRRSIDEVIDAPRTNRFTISEIEKTEKTYLGTKIEILLRAHLGFPKGALLDLSVHGTEVDIKNTTGTNWAIPTEAIDHPCMLIRENESTARCSVGLFVAREPYLNPGKNKDQKRGISASAASNIWWLLRDHPYPPNFFETIPLQQRAAIMEAGSAKHRLAELFIQVQGRPISREIVQAIAQQPDYMKRLRKNGGARDLLAPMGTAILWGQNDSLLIKALGLPPVGPDEFISVTPSTPTDIALLRKAGHIT
ncbi:MAG TPA: NaeI family type II restriction endonuclease [Tepidisphaeraceae bacterium]|nr:NaeI family type II restriction endonuclease [Tepidisphaeraceae bacterium]